MTTIAWDGEIMAADSMTTTTGGMAALNVGKLKRGRDFVAGAAGCSAQIELWWRGVSGLQLAEILEAGYTEFVEDKNDPSIMLCSQDGRLFTHSQGAFLEFQGTISGRKCWAIGSGGEVALGAMLAGAGAEMAVHLAAEIDPYTGGPINWMRA